MRLALGIVALACLWPAGARADGPPTSPDAAGDECGPPDPGNGSRRDIVHRSTSALERANIQWQRNPRLGLGVGPFLTPYGMWSADPDPRDRYGLCYQLDAPASHEAGPDASCLDLTVYVPGLPAICIKP